MYTFLKVRVKTLRTLVALTFPSIPFNFMSILEMCAAGHIRDPQPNTDPHMDLQLIRAALNLTGHNSLISMSVWMYINTAECLIPLTLLSRVTWVSECSRAWNESCISLTPLTSTDSSVICLSLSVFAEWRLYVMWSTAQTSCSCDAFSWIWQFKFLHATERDDIQNVQLIMSIKCSL